MTDIEKVHAYLNKKIFDPNLTLYALCSDLTIAYSALYEMFIKKFKMSPWQYVKKKRLEVAVKQFNFNSHTLAKIALEVGYQHLKTFRYACKRRLGLKPHELKERIYNSEDSKACSRNFIDKLWHNNKNKIGVH